MKPHYISAIQNTHCKLPYLNFYNAKMHLTHTCCLKEIIRIIQSWAYLNKLTNNCIDFFASSIVVVIYVHTQLYRRNQQLCVASRFWVKIIYTPT